MTAVAMYMMFCLNSDRNTVVCRQMKIMQYATAEICLDASKTYIKRGSKSSFLCKDVN